MKLVLCFAVLMFTAAATCSNNTGTGAGSGSGSSFGDTVTSCATVDIGKTLPDIGMTIFQDVKTIIKAGAAGWEDALVALGVKYGYDALTCAIKAVYTELTAHPAGTQAPPLSDAAKRAQSFMASHNLKANP